LHFEKRGVFLTLKRKDIMIKDVLKRTNSSTIFMTLLIFVVISGTVLSSIVYGQDKCCCSGICFCEGDPPIPIIYDRGYYKFDVQPCNGENVCEYLCSKYVGADLDFAAFDCYKCNGEEGCPIELIYGGKSEQTELLRLFRDNVLSKTPEGRQLIKLYYQWSPVMVRAMKQDEEFREEVKKMINSILPVIGEAVE
jgi:hypothetical protein